MGCKSLLWRSSWNQDVPDSFEIENRLLFHFAAGFDRSSLKLHSGFISDLTGFNPLTT